MGSVIVFGAKYLILILLLIAIAAVFKQSKENRMKILIFAVITLPVAYIVAKIASLLYYDPRPFVVGPPAGGFTPLVAHIADNGFPSDHTLLSSTAAAVIYYFDKKTGTVLFALALLVGIARVLAGVHHVIDVAGSFMIAIAIPFFIYKLILPLMLKSKIYQKVQK